MFEVGHKYLRRELHDKYGGNRQGGISPSRSQPIILLFLSGRGAEFGYKDEWKGNILHFYGEGQSGDMKMVRGNAAVKDHEANGKELHLFEERGGGYVEYRGQMKYAGMEERRGHDVSGRLGIASYSIWLQSTRPLRSIF